MALDTVPVEISDLILDNLALQDIRRLRLVCHHLNTIASRRTMKALEFCLCKADFDMLRSIANSDYAENVTSLKYNSGMLSSKRLNFTTHSEWLQRGFGPKGWTPAQVDETPLTDAELHRYFDLYDRMCDEQRDILDRNTDYEALEAVISKLGKLDEVFVWSGWDGRDDFDRANWSFERRGVVEQEVSMGGVDYGDGNARHLRALIRGVHNAGIKLRAIRAVGMHHSFFDPERFSLADMTHLFENLTVFEMEVSAFADWDVGHHNNQQEVLILLPHVVDGSQCRTMMQKGVLLTALRHMPNLVSLTLKIRSIIRNWTLVNGTCDPPSLEDTIPLDHSWPKLESLVLEGMYADQAQLANLILGHKDTLNLLSLEGIRILNGSLVDLLPQLKAGLVGRNVSVELGWSLEDSSNIGVPQVVKKHWVKREYREGHPDPVRDYFRDPEITELPLDGRHRGRPGSWSDSDDDMGFGLFD
ncbi:hypothetical protein OQA88_8444 [Cercophora sp. LCS_1]